MIVTKFIIMYIIYQVTRQTGIRIPHLKFLTSEESVKHYEVNFCHKIILTGSYIQSPVYVSPVYVFDGKYAIYCRDQKYPE